jgi:tetratricopeptide (TPR) repeat protein
MVGFRWIWPALVLFLAGCAATPQATHLLTEPPAELLQPTELQRVPFFPQEAFHCGPAALATLLNANGIAVQPDDLAPQVYVPERQGSLQLELIAAVRRHGRLPYVLQPRLTDVLREVESGQPVLVLQNLGTAWYPVWHYAVVVGYDLEKNELVLRSGTQPRHVVSLQLFERTWQRADRWAVIIVTPGSLSVTMQESAYLNAVLGLEAIARWPDAIRAYRSGLARWPANNEMRMGLGNSQYAIGRLDDAAETYQDVLQRDSNYAAAHNNLAQVYLDLEQLHNALSHAETAVALGGKHAHVYQQTLQAVQDRLAAQ